MAKTGFLLILPYCLCCKKIYLSSITSVSLILIRYGATGVVPASRKGRHGLYPLASGLLSNEIQIEKQEINTHSDIELHYYFYSHFLSSHFSRRRGSEWEVLEGLKDGQRFEKRPDVFNGYLHKKRKWPLKGWHKVTPSLHFCLTNKLVTQHFKLSLMVA